MSRDEVYAAALALIDRSGLAALTIRDLAQSLQVAVGTVYATAGGKEDILQGVADLVFAELPEPDLFASDWTASLVSSFEAVHRRMREHPAVAQLAVLEPLVGPRVLAGHASVFALLFRAGLSDSEAVALYTTLASYTTGFVLYQISRRREGTNAEAAATIMLGRAVPDALSDAQFRDGLQKIIRGFHPTEKERDR